MCPPLILLRLLMASLIFVCRRHPPSWQVRHDKRGRSQGLPGPMFTLNHSICFGWFVSDQFDASALHIRIIRIPLTFFLHRFGNVLRDRILDALLFLILGGAKAPSLLRRTHEFR